MLDRITLNIHKNNVAILIMVCITALVCLSANGGSAAHRAPNRKVVGVVVDSISGERLPFVNVYSKKGKAGTTTNDNGVFTLHVPVGTGITVSSLGYDPNMKKTTFSADTLRFFMSPSTTELTEVVVKPKKQKYSKKNNPAVDLMQRVRADRDKVDPTNAPFYSYDRYDKMVLGINNYNGYLPDENGKVKGRNKALASLVDTAIWSGKRVLDISMKEKYATRITTADGKDKEVVTGQRNNGVDKSLDQNYTRAIFEDILREVNVYDNDIPVMRSRFVSPLSRISADFYMFHIEDTVYIGKDRCVELSFAPHSPETAGFNGKLYVPVDDSIKWVRRVLMRMPKAANVNYVQDLYISQTFDKDSLGYVHKKLDDLMVEVHIVGPIGESYMSRQSRYENQSYDKRNDLADFYDKVGSVFEIDESTERNQEFWNERRLVPLSYAEKQLSLDESPFRKMPLINLTIKVVELIVKGYVTTGKNSKFDIGPIDTFASYNGTEGLRLSFGGMTTANLSKHWFFRGYGAYGFHDRKWKYRGEVEYSFVPKKYHSREFPMNGIRLSYKYDVNNLGQYFMTSELNNPLNSIKRMESNLSTYERLGVLEYNIEWRNHLSMSAKLQYQRQESSPIVPFEKADGSFSKGYTQNTITLGVRWAPNEKFMQTNNERHPINKDALILALNHTFGPKGLFGSEFTMNMTELLVTKRIWFSAFGYTDIIFKAAKLWSQVQFPALLWQNANIAYTIKPESFSLLNPMEFAVDQYVSLDINYNMNGILLNRIPWIKRFKLREIVTFKGFYGSLTKKNNPEYNDNLYRFPATALAQEMGHKPYMEIGAGIDNLFTFLRVQYFWRLSYRNTPGAPNSGLRFAFVFGF